MIGIIYCYTSPYGKPYVGQTTDERRRKYQHKCNTFNETAVDYNKPFYKAVRKYGWDSFYYEVLWRKECDDLELLRKLLNKMEEFYIEQLDALKNGYNCTSGGNSIHINSEVGHCLTEEHKEKLRKSASRVVCQYDLDGNYIKTWESAAEAERYTGAGSSQIIACCRGKAKTSKGFQWCYDGNTCGKYESPVRKSPGKFGKDNKQSKKVYEYDVNWKLIKVWDSLMDISRDLQINSGSLCHAIKDEHFYKEAYWRYVPIDGAY